MEAVLDDNKAVLSIATGEGTRTNVDENVESKLQGTGGMVSYPLRVALAPITVASGDQAGAVKLTVPLDDFVEDTQVAALKQRFMFYKISDVVMNIQSVSPWSTASGSVQVFYNKDPENSIAGQSGTVPIRLALRLLRSQQASAKMKDNFALDNSELTLAPLSSDWRFCKKGASPYPRLERYGDIMIAVRAVPATGDGVLYTVTLAANILFKDATFNSTLSAYKVPFKSNENLNAELEIVDGSMNILLNLDPIDHDNQLLTASGDFRLNTPAQIVLEIADASDDDAPTERYNITFSQGAFNADSDGLTLVISTTITATNQHQTPVVSNFDILTPEVPDFKKLTGWLVYLSENDNFTFSGHNMGTMPVAIMPQPTKVRMASNYMSKFAAKHPNLTKSRMIYHDCDAIIPF